MSIYSDCGHLVSLGSFGNNKFYELEKAQDD